MATVELDDLWGQEKNDEFTVEEERQLWELIRTKVNRTLVAFHVLGLILHNDPARHSKSASDETYTNLIDRHENAYQDFMSWRKIYKHTTPHPTHADVSAIQASLTLHVEAFIGPKGRAESQRRQIHDFEAKLLVLSNTAQDAYHWIRGAGFVNPHFYRSAVLSADEALIALRKLYWDTKSFLVGEERSHDWLAGDLSTMNMDIEGGLRMFLEDMFLVNDDGTFVVSSLKDTPIE
ncbi:MAG: hypothetical protein M1822_007972 [Bathelium mastoideum]|nr:MAG: hypothetical protein M1822_007972 [Bathelium mastoideum]